MNLITSSYLKMSSWAWSGRLTGICHKQTKLQTCRPEHGLERHTGTDKREKRFLLKEKVKLFWEGIIRHDAMKT